MTENEKKIIKILEEVLALEDSGETITADSDLINDLAAESIDLLISVLDWKRILISVK